MHMDSEDMDMNSGKALVFSWPKSISSRQFRPSEGSHIHRTFLNFGNIFEYIFSILHKTSPKPQFLMTHTVGCPPKGDGDFDRTNKIRSRLKG